MQRAHGQSLASIRLGSLHDSDNNHSCGYCGKSNGARTWGFSAQKLPADFYETLMNRGWRRCGTYYYKMNMSNTCCPAFTIKANTNQFKIKKNQKKAVKNLISLVSTHDPKSQKKVQTDSNNKKDHKKLQISIQNKHQNKIIQPKEITNDIKQQIEELTNIVKNVNEILANKHKELISLLPQTPQLELNFNILQGLKIFISQNSKKGDFYSNYILLLYGINKKLFKKLSLQIFCQKLSDFINNTFYQICQKYDYNIQYSGYLIFKKKTMNTLQIEADKLIQSDKNKKQASHTVPQKIVNPSLKQDIQKVASKGIFIPQNIKKQSNEKWPELVITSQKMIFGKLEVLIVPVQKDAQSFAMYSKYSKNIHDKTKQSMSGYTNFLCEDALNRQTSIKEIQKLQYSPIWDESGEHQPPIVAKGKIKKNQGCFHMKYFLEKKLIGVGVVDIVYGGMSSVYFFYDHNYKQHRLGVFSTLMEIEYIRYINRAFPEFNSYYLGFYIHDCHKMNYKIDYEPCELLCPVTYNYIPVTKQLRQKLDEIVAKKSKVRLSPENDLKNPSMMVQGDVGLFINQNLKLMKGRVIQLQEIQKQYLVPILMLLKMFIEEAGGDIFARTKFQL